MKRPFVIMRRLRLGRLTRDAALYSGAMLAGYAAGIALIVFRLYRFERWYYAPHRGETQDPASSLADLEPFAPALQSFRYDDSFWTIPVAALAGVVVYCIALLTPAFLAMAVARVAPLRLAPGRLDAAPASQRCGIRRQWREALRSASPRWPWALAAGALAGLAGAVIGDTYAMAANLAWEEDAWARGAMPGTSPIVRPLFGLWTAPDAAWLLGCAVLLPAATAVVLARSALRRDPAFLARWCPGCGYPRPAAAEPGPGPPPPAAPCPECGAAPAPVRRQSRPRRRAPAVALLLTLALVMAVHIKGPVVIETVVRMIWGGPPPP